MEASNSHPDRDAALRELFSDRTHFREDCRLMMQAIRNDWPISDQIATLIPERIFAVVNDPQSTSRERVRAAELLVEMQSANFRQARERLERLPGN